MPCRAGATGSSSPDTTDFAAWPSARAVARRCARKQKPLERFFPELARALLDLQLERFVIDGEIVLRNGAFETLQLRLHPAQSRIEKLAAEHPASLIAFDLLID